MKIWVPGIGLNTIGFTPAITKTKISQKRSCSQGNVRIFHFSARHFNYSYMKYSCECSDAKNDGNV